MNMKSSKLLTMIKFNYRRTAMKKSFIVITILGPVLILAMTVLPSILTEKSLDSFSGAEVEIYGGNPAVVEAIIASSSEILTLSKSEDLELSRQRAAENGIDGLLVLPDDPLSSNELVFYTSNASDIMLTETVRNVVGQIVTSMRISGEGLDPVKVASLTAKPRLDVIQLKKGGEEKEAQDFTSFIYSAIAFIMLLYMTTLLYSQMIGREVVGEKTSKTVEVMLSSVKPVTLMLGKILGLGLAGISQYVVWIAASLLLIKVVGPVFNLSMPSVFSVDMLGYLVLFFLLAFFLYSCLYAATGALAEDEQSMGQLQMPMLIPLILPMVMISYFVMNPDSGISLFFSLFPLTSPMVMFVRLMVGQPPVWQIALCVLILIVSIAGVAIASGKIFRQAILMTGKAKSLKDGFKMVIAK